MIRHAKFALWLSVASVGWAAISTSPVHSALGTTSVTVTAPANGNVLVAAISAVRSSGARTVSSIALTNVTGWTKLSGTTSASGGLDTEIWCGNAGASSGTALTITMSGTGSTVVSVVTEWSGVLTPCATTGKDGTGNSATGTSGSPSDAGYSTRAACTGDLAYAAIGYTGNASAPTVLPSGHTGTSQFTNSTTTIAVQGSYKVPAAAGSQTISWTMTSELYVAAVNGLLQSAAPCTVTAADTTLSNETTARLAAFLHSPGGLTTLSSETLARIAAYTHAPGGLTALSSEIVSRSKTWPPAALADTTLSAESSARINGMVRTAADTPLSSESTARAALSLPRSAADGTLSEAIARLAGYPRSASDTSLSAESTLGSHGLPRSAAGTTLSAESPLRLSAFGRGSTDGALSSEALARSVAAMRSPSTVAALSAESTLPLVAILRAAAGTALSNEIVARSKAWPAVGVADTALSSETPVWLSALGRGSADTTVSSESTARAASLQRGPADGTVSSELAARGAIALMRIDSLTALVSEASGRLLVSLRTPGGLTALSSVTVGDVKGAGSTDYPRGISLTAFASEATARLSGLLRGPAEGPLSAESAVRNAIIFARAPAGLTAFVSELPRRLFASLRSPGGLTVLSSEAALAPIGHVRSVADNASSNAALARDAILFSRQPTGVVTLSSESPLRARGIPRSANDEMTLATAALSRFAVWVPGAIAASHAFAVTIRTALFAITPRVVGFTVAARIVDFVCKPQ